MTITPQQAFDILDKFPDCYYLDEQSGAHISVEAALDCREEDPDPDAFSYLFMFDWSDDLEQVCELYFYHRNNAAIELTACGQGLILVDEEGEKRTVFPLGKQNLMPFIEIV